MNVLFPSHLWLLLKFRFNRMDRYAQMLKYPISAHVWNFIGTDFRNRLSIKLQYITQLDAQLVFVILDFVNLQYGLRS